MTMPSSALRHVILTRFNLATPGRESKLRNDPTWLEHRFDLFEKYCLPSVAVQSNKAFNWLIFFDENTPPAFRERIERGRAIFPYTPVFTPLFPAEGWRIHALAAVADDPRTELLTSTLDNDDAISIDYVERLQQAACRYAGKAPVALNFTNGLILKNGQLFFHQHYSSAFRSLLEPYGDALRTAGDVPHMEMGQHFPLKQIEGSPAWLQVVHERNVSNKTRGSLISPADFKGMFPDSILREVQEPSGAARMFDVMVLEPLRKGRDAGIRMVKAVRQR